MPASRTALFGALASAALLAGTVAAFAQNRAPQANRLIAVPIRDDAPDGPDDGRDAA
jgi:hypothetical protein